MLRRIALRVSVVALALIGLAGFLYLYGLRIDWNGNMSHVRIKNLARNNARVEESRAAQRSEPAPVPAPVEKPAEIAAVPVKLIKTAYWTDFRGPNRAGEYSESPINTEWPVAGLPRL